MTLLLDPLCQMIREKTMDFGTSFDPPTSNILVVCICLQTLLLMVELRQPPLHTSNSLDIKLSSSLYHSSSIRLLYVVVVTVVLAFFRGLKDQPTARLSDLLIQDVVYIRLRYTFNVEKSIKRNIVKIGI